MSRGYQRGTRVVATTQKLGDVVRAEQQNLIHRSPAMFSGEQHELLPNGDVATEERGPLVMSGPLLVVGALLVVFVERGVHRGGDVVTPTKSADIHNSLATLLQSGNASVFEAAGRDVVHQRLTEEVIPANHGSVVVVG